MTLLAPRRTPHTARAIEAALRQALGSDVRGLRLLMALVDLETRGGRAVWCHNLGNIIATGGDGDTFRLSDAGNPREFRAYPSLRAGAKGLVRQITSRTRPAWSAALRTGEPRQFVAALAGQHGGPRYFEAHPDAYLAAFLRRWRTYRGVDGASATAPVGAVLGLLMAGWVVSLAFRRRA